MGLPDHGSGGSQWRQKTLTVLSTEGDWRSGEETIICPARSSAAAGTAENANATPAAVKQLGGDVRMKIAVTYENQEVFQHFGHCEAFKI